MVKRGKVKRRQGLLGRVLPAPESGQRFGQGDAAAGESARIALRSFWLQVALEEKLDPAAIFGDLRLATLHSRTMTSHKLELLAPNQGFGISDHLSRRRPR